MKLRIGFKTLCVTLALMVSSKSYSMSIVSSNPMEYGAMTKGYSSLLSTYGKQSAYLSGIDVAAGGVALADRKMRKWEQKYYEYLSTAEGYAQQLKAACTLYAEGMQTLVCLYNVHAACKINPQGIAASIPFNNLYIETAVEFLKSFEAVDSLVAGGGGSHLLNGAERTKCLWEITYNLEDLNTKLRRLASSILVYSFDDVWNHATAGMVQKSNRQLAEEAIRRFRRAAINTSKFYMIAK